MIPIDQVSIYIYMRPDVEAIFGWKHQPPPRFMRVFLTNPSGGSEKNSKQSLHPLVMTSLFQRLWGENLTQELRNIAKATPANRTVTLDEVSRVGWMLREGGSAAVRLVGWGAVGDVRWKGDERWGW